MFRGLAMYVESLQRVLKIASLAICRRVATYKVKLRSVAFYTFVCFSCCCRLLLLWWWFCCCYWGRSVWRIKFKDFIMKSRGGDEHMYCYQKLRVQQWMQDWSVWWLWSLAISFSVFVSTGAVAVVAILTSKLLLMMMMIRPWERTHTSASAVSEIASIH